MLTAEAVTSGYGPVHVLDGVSVEVRSGEIVALVGANGAGKTTLVRTLAGQLPLRSGRIRMDDTDLGSVPPHRRARMGLIMVPEGRRLFGTLTVRENIALGRAAIHKRGGSDPFEVLGEIFPIVRERAAQPAGLLSGGEQQQVALARALVGRPRYLILDEPSLGLSPALTTQLFGTIAAIRDQLGIGVLLVEQMVDRALALADRAYVLERGRVTLAGTAAEVAGSDSVRQAYLGAIDAGAPESSGGAA